MVWNINRFRKFSKYLISKALAKRFSKHFGRVFGRYLNQLKIRKPTLEINFENENFEEAMLFAAEFLHICFSLVYFQIGVCGT